MLASCPPAEAWALAHDYRISASKAGQWMVVGGGGADGVPALLALIVPLSAFCVGQKCLSLVVILLGEDVLLFRGFSQRQRVAMTCLMSPLLKQQMFGFSVVFENGFFGSDAPGSRGSKGKLLRVQPN